MSQHSQKYINVKMIADVKTTVDFTQNVFESVIITSSIHILNYTYDIVYSKHLATCIEATVHFVR